jgi:predicted transcriptional regulator
MRKLLSVSIPDDLKDDLEASARDRGTTTSELVREALRAHLWQLRLSAIQAYGAEQAEARGVAPEDVERIVDQVRDEARTSRRT